MQVQLALAGLVGGLCVGLTGVGGGALMTPMLVLALGVDPLAAVSTDVTASLVMKPVGGSVHLRRGSVHTGIVGWLALGSIPAAFLGAWALQHLGEGPVLAERLRWLLGVTLLVAAIAMVARLLLAGRSAQRGPGGWINPEGPGGVPVRRGATLAVGALGGAVVGLTSVGSGSLVIVLLMALYPRLESRCLVGTDLVQAVPLVAAASAGHLLFGDVQLALTGALLVGCVPGAYLGARLSSRASERLIRPVLGTVLVASATKLLGWPTTVAVGAAVVLGAICVHAERPRPPVQPARSL